MKIAIRWRRTIAAILCGTFSVGMAQPMWPAQKMLDSSTSPAFTVRNKNGQVLELIDRQAVANASDVLRKLAPAYGMQEPPLFITPARSPNAFAATTRDGHNIVAINSAMLRLIGNSPDRLAVVMGHELAHLQARHTTDGAQRAATIGLLGALLGAAIDVNQAKHGHDTRGLGSALGRTGAGLVNAKFSRDQEREADHLGITAMAKAGFDPSAASGFWRLMASGGGGGNGTWLDSHPSSAEREQTLALLAQQVQPLYAASTTRSTGTPAAEMQAAPEVDPYPRSAFTSLQPTEWELSENTEYARARTAYREKRYDESLRLFESLAAAGDERAVTMLGAHALMGHGRPVDLKEARENFEKAAAKGFGRALAALGEMASSGRGRDKDVFEAARMYRLAAARDDYRAMAHLAMMHLSGAAGIAKDAEEARRLAGKAYAGADPMGKALYGAMLRDGLGGPADVQLGFSMIDSVADSVPWAKYQLGVSYERGLGVPADRAKATFHYEQAARAGVGAAAARLQALSR